MNAFQLACLNQIIEATVITTSFISDGSSSKVVEDVIVSHLETSERGLVIVACGVSGVERRISWRMKHADVAAIINAFYRCEVQISGYLSETRLPLIPTKSPILAYIDTYNRQTFLLA